MSAFRVGQLVVAVQGQCHLELIGRPGTVLRVGIPCTKPYSPREETPGLLVDVADHGPIQGAYACWIPVDDCDPQPSLTEDEEMDEEMLA